jgi:CBS domain-containing protein
MASTVKNLMPESQTLVTAREEMTVQDALELMIEHDFSQLPVVDDSFQVKGLITSDSILRGSGYLGSKLDKIKVSHVINKATTCRDDDELSILLNGLKDASAIPIVDKFGKLIAIVTDYDTAEYYRQRAEDMILAEEIETSLRDYIESAYKDAKGDPDKEALRSAIEDITPSGKDLKNKFKQALCKYLSRVGQTPPQPNQQFIDDVFTQYLHQPIAIQPIEKLTLSDYIQLFKNVWDKYEAAFNGLEWDAIYKVLDEVRQTRNAIAHFRDVSPNQRKQLKFCASLLDRHRFILNEKISLSDAIPSVINDEQLSSAIVEVPLQPTEGFQGEFPPIDEEIGSNESRYAPLAIWLQSQTRNQQENLLLSFEQIETIIDDKLPPSARQQRTWWANDSVGHTQSQQWLEVGWRVSSVNMGEEKVVFSLMGDRQSAYISFFSELQSKLQDIKGLTVQLATNPQGQSWLSFEISSAEHSEKTWLNFAFARKSRFRLELYIDFGDRERNKFVFDKLHAYKAEIESKLGERLSWERLESRRASRVALYYERVSITNESEALMHLQDWAVEMLPRFYRAIVVHLKMATGSKL